MQLLRQIGDLAHNIARSPSGPRGSTAVSVGEINEPENLILLCRNHHGEVDGDPETYTEKRLREMKTAHESRMLEKVHRIMPRITYVELEEVTSHLMGTPAAPASSFDSTPIRMKMDRNDLGEYSRNQLAIGIPKAPEVENFIGAKMRLDVDFPERLKASFVDVYERERLRGLKGDELFNEVAQIALTGSSDFKRLAAGLAVLAYLFEACEVFEK
ncbi:MAG: hypothetical protein JRN35_09745 [Nitrososphaerota archaeon]|jgi:hypothetical protein|nr:hypothetical protein [Nitrososphaerota archaeon]